MCGRYTFDKYTEDEKLIGILDEINRKYPDNPIKLGEIFPTNPAAVLVGYGKRIEAERMSWGFPNFRNKGVIINARVETITEKPMFSKHIELHRCVVPSTGFYEWSQDGEKTKYRFNIPNKKSLYMAGIYNVFKAEARFVILTTAANRSMERIHHRMPVILEETEIEPWITRKEEASIFLHRIPVQLSGVRIDK